MCRRVVFPRIKNALAECSTIVHGLYGGFAIHHALCKTNTLKIQEFRLKLVDYLLVQNHKRYNSLDLYLHYWNLAGFLPRIVYPNFIICQGAYILLQTSLKKRNPHAIITDYPERYDV